VKLVELSGPKEGYLKDKINELEKTMRTKISENCTEA
jgi:hypothetical protein